MTLDHFDRHLNSYKGVDRHDAVKMPRLMSERNDVNRQAHSPTFTSDYSVMCVPVQAAVIAINDALEELREAEQDLREIPE